MDKVKKIYYKDQEVIIVDYSNSKEAEMIEVIRDAKDLIVKERKPILVVSIFNAKNYVTPKFMRYVEKELKEAEPFISKNAITGLSETQKWILKGVNLWYKRKIHYFKSLQEALDFVVERE